MRKNVALLLVPLAIQLYVNPVSAQQCVDTDGDGWGWDGSQSCLIPATAGACIDTDGDGWGWNGIESCLIGDTTTDTTDTTDGNDNAGEAENMESGSLTCIDTDGDGWGWNGVESCLIPATAGACIDTDGDGWGWNGVESCLIDDTTDGGDDNTGDDNSDDGSTDGDNDNTGDDSSDDGSTDGDEDNTGDDNSDAGSTDGDDDNTGDDSSDDGATDGDEDNSDDGSTDGGDNNTGDDNSDDDATDGDDDNTDDETTEDTFALMSVLEAPETLNENSTNLLAFVRGPNRSFRVRNGEFQEFDLYPAEYDPSGISFIRFESTIENGTPIAFSYGSLLGRLPRALTVEVPNIYFLDDNSASNLYIDAQGEYNLELGLDYAIALHSEGVLEEELMYQLAQIKYLDDSTSATWLAAVESDGKALVDPMLSAGPAHDIASTFVYYWALRYSPDALSDAQSNAIQMDVPARIQWFDDNATDVAP